MTVKSALLLLPYILTSNVNPPRINSGADPEKGQWVMLVRNFREYEGLPHHLLALFKGFAETEPEKEHTGPDFLVRASALHPPNKEEFGSYMEFFAAKAVYLQPPEQRGSVARYAITTPEDWEPYMGMTSDLHVGKKSIVQALRDEKKFWNEEFNYDVYANLLENTDSFPSPTAKVLRLDDL
ncbi:hypothetical protein KY338_01615 [Candidatus Woesearchaeota archaeon]|nr:hypothetical protein [Candidatus Woesearchaeota archaeon]MBW3005611.1 hypothetical protein [Candidatus Woesearchaeota archaeon]